ncbi:MAG: hypothetical protein AAF184_02810 [Pseudomonadota bacterium]
MSDRRFDIETVVLTREYLETVHGRMTFSDAEDGEEATVLLGESPAADTSTDQPIEPLAS